MKLAVILALSQLAVEVGEIGPSSIHEGLLTRSNNGFDFRGCDSGEIYFVDGSYSIQDEVDQFFAAQTNGATRSIFVRFHGEVIEDVDGLPDKYVEVIRITNLLSYSATIPAGCK